MVRHPGAAALSLTLLLAPFFMVGGLFRVVGVVLLRFPNWAWACLSGVIAFLLGVMLVLERLLGEEREAIHTDPEREQAVLQDTMQRHGFDEATARAATRELSRDPERALTLYSRAVLGVNPEGFGSSWAAALSSLVTFAVGALMPLVPWFITTGVSAVVSSLVLVGGAAVAIDGLLGQLTGGRWRRSALRRLLVVAMASGITFLVGKLFGTMVL